MKPFPLAFAASRLAVFLAAFAAPWAQAQAPIRFVDQSNVFATREATSAPVVVTGLAAPAPVSVAGGTYSIGCAGPWVATAGIIADGQSVCVRHIASATPGGTAATTLTVGAVSDTFDTTTAATNAAALIAGYYRAILRREADPGGQAFWESEALRLTALGVDINETWRVMAIAFFDSAEYRAFGRNDAGYVTDLYLTFFNRAPETGGIPYWTGLIAAGLPRQAVALSFLFSGEFATYTRSLFGTEPSRGEVDLVVDFYRGLLNRLPDSTGFGYWLARFRVAQCAGTAAVLSEAETISSQFLSGPEYAARARSHRDFVTDLYNAFLRRGGDLPGFQFWAGELEAGRRSRDEVRRAFMSSAEFQARIVRAAVQGCLPSLGQSSVLAPQGVAPGATPFIARLDLSGNNLERITGVRFTVAPKAGSASRAVSASYSAAHLAAKGYGIVGTGQYRLPVFGLYAGHANAVRLDVSYDDGSSRQVTVEVATAAYADPFQAYDRPTRLVPRAPGAPLGFDFVFMKSVYGPPVVVDTDGEIRWTVPGSLSAFASAFVENAFVLGDANGLTVRRLELDGTSQDTALAGPYWRFHHNIDPGKTGWLAELDALTGAVPNYENLLVEMTPEGQVIREWDFAAIIADHMRSQGDDPTAFVRLGYDWFHMNSAAYDPRDDSLVVSSRENFVIKIDYATGRIDWILGDPTKHWYAFPSLRAKALTLESGLWPIGQHALAFDADGNLLLFNNGRGSLNQPVGAAEGETRPYSAVSAYAIDAATRSAREVYRFDYGQSIRSDFCSSAYPAADRSLLVMYSFVGFGTRARMVGLDPSRNVVFDFEYPSGPCQAAWNAEPIPFEDLRFP